MHGRCEKANVVQITVWRVKNRGYKIRAALAEEDDIPDPPDQYSCDNSGRGKNAVALLTDILNGLKAAYPRSGSTTISLCVDGDEILQSTACDQE
jgi:hypothetical protein